VSDLTELLERQLEVFAHDVGELYRRQKERTEELERALATLKTSYLETIRSLAFVVEAKDAYTGQHLERCRVYGMALMDALGISADHPDAEYGFLLHDAGKVAVPDAILFKPGPLTPDERAVIEQHPVKGAEIVRDIEFLGAARDVIRWHHERWDGTGYPDRLAGTDIPLSARVFAVADALDALTSDRPYRRASSLPQARLAIVRDSGTHFDPDVVAAFESLPDSVLERIREEIR
jgi:HD-GYP domain-containing protein (c-di-GMP phosphodiesterase class II)